MTDLQKDQAIYQALVDIATEVFNHAVSRNKELQEFMNEKGGVVTIGEITKPHSEVYPMILMFTPIEQKTVTVDTFTCSFPAVNVFDYAKQWKSFAKDNGKLIFTYKEDVQREFVGTVDIAFDKPSNAKLLAKCVANDVLRPNMGMVLLEINATSGDISFVASDGRQLGCISNNPSSIHQDYNTTDMVFQGLFGKNDWELICDYAKKENSSVTFEIYERGMDKDGYNEETDTIVAILGDLKVKSQQKGRYPNWKSVLPDVASLHHSTIHPDDVREAQKFISKVKTNDYQRKVRITVYKGSDLIYFDTEECTRTYRITETSDVTISTSLSIDILKSKKFYGFYFSGDGGANLIDDESSDLMLIMPYTGCYAPHKEEREVIHHEIIEEELVAA